MKTVIFLLFALASVTNAHAWGKRGHALVCETAAYVAASQSPENTFLKQSSFDFAYYCNVPDLIWKRPENYKKEFTNHFMNLEAFQREKQLKINSKDNSDFLLSRKEFNEKYENIPVRKGRSWWRIQELDKRIAKITQQLKKQSLTKKNKQNLQEKWLTLVGVAGHYIGDLAMPLHVSENYDGQMTEQKGLHHYFEETLVDELFLNKKKTIQDDVYKKALKKWPEFFKDSQNKSLLYMIQKLSLDSQTKISTLLDLDKKTGRKDLKKSLKAYRKLVVDRLSQGVLYQAYFINRHLGWEFDGERFYNFNERPDFIKPKN